jgi:hypothetical protein
MLRPLAELVERWCEESGVAPDLRPTPAQLEANFWTGTKHTRVGTDLSRILNWERRFGFVLPDSLKTWLRLSDGFYGENGPLIHPLSAIGPMVPFARVPGLVVEPESWFELGNPNVETICLDLAYRWPGGDCPVFTSGDDESGSAPRVIAAGFDEWFLRMLASGGREYWFDRGFSDLGDPWRAHLRNVPAPGLSDRLRPLAERVSPLVHAGLDDRAIAARFGISPFDVEAIVRHVQHAGAGKAG